MSTVFAVTVTTDRGETSRFDLEVPTATEAVTKGTEMIHQGEVHGEVTRITAVRVTRDTESSASRQHWVDTGRYLNPGEAIQS